MNPQKYSDKDVEKLAAKASVCTRTMVRALAGLPVRGLAGARVAKVLAELEKKEGAR